MTDQPNIVADIKARADLSAFDFTRAEHRAAFDAWLRAELGKIDDEHVRAHAVDMIREWRHELFGLPSQVLAADLIARLEAVEAYLGLTPAPRRAPQEIHTLRRHDDG